MLTDNVTNTISKGSYDCILNLPLPAGGQGHYSCLIGPSLTGLPSQGASPARLPDRQTDTEIKGDIS